MVQAVYGSCAPAIRYPAENGKGEGTVGGFGELYQRDSLSAAVRTSPVFFKIIQGEGGRFAGSVPENVLWGLRGLIRVVRLGRRRRRMGFGQSGGGLRYTLISTRMFWSISAAVVGW